VNILSTIFLIIFGLVLFASIRKLYLSKVSEADSNSTGAADYIFDGGDLDPPPLSTGHEPGHASHHHNSSHDFGGHTGGHDSFDGGFDGGGHH
jgi:hypothetical protein